MKKSLLILASFFLVQMSFAQEELLNILKTELNRNFEVLSKESTPAYYMNYRVFDSEGVNISAQFGNITQSNPFHNKYYHIVVRVGTPELDNTHELKESRGSNLMLPSLNKMFIENSDEIKKRLWFKTDETYKNAVSQFENVKANVAIKVDSEDKSPDFSNEKPEVYIEKPKEFKNLHFDAKKWENKLKKYSAVFTKNKDIYSCNVYLSAELKRFYFVDTDGSEIYENQLAFKLNISASTIADDGMNLPLYESYFAFDAKDFPSDDEIIKDAERMSELLSKLRVAPTAETYSGPAILSPSATGVFFHEIFGHRIEGSRLKKEQDAQTFKKKVGEVLLPEDFSIWYNPQLKEYHGFKLAGNYIYDDEGVKGQKVSIIENGRLNSFLMSRSPIEGFPNSNGHGRAMIQSNAVTRQSNMVLETTQPHSKEELRAMLIEQLNKTDKPYGYYFEKVSGGFTTTGRYMPNAFNLSPLVVYKVFTDGRPDELVRGVDLVGTPLSMFSQITAAGKEYDVFNGMCGAESGFVPVSSVTPAVYVQMIETQKQGKSQSKKPILERP